jgi:glutathione S-transferase
VTVRLHRCPVPTPGFAAELHSCARVQKALDEQGVDYEVVKEPVARGKRIEVQRLSGQKLLPVIEFEDGTAYRAESKDMAERIRAGKLFEQRKSPVS